MSDRELAKVYNPKDFEDKWYQFWQDKNYFHASANEQKNNAYTIVIPPPNVTAQLHMGHGLNSTLQDVLIRWKKMSGMNTLWMPGTDHAGIATQNVVEKKLAKEKTNRHDLGREKFVEEVWKWKEEYGSIIIDQLKKMGCSCDWSRERFTMDEGLSKAVREVFIRFYEAGLIYKGKYIVNWCPRCTTALSNEEVDHEDKNSFLYHIKYPVKGENRFIEVATTRPETMLGDTAVAVNPKDERYKDLIGKTLILPLVNREIPVVADDYTKMEFGTGAVKVTPAHDPNDFLIGKRHNLEQINVMNPDGTMSKNAGEAYEGLDRFKCRKKVVQDLEEQGLFISKEAHNNSVGHCYRCHTVLEPYLSDQWFVKMKPLAEKAIEVAQKDRVRFYPEKWKKVYLHWLENIEDWCISRQLWWGHRIPVWTCKDCGEVLVEREDPDSCKKCNSKNIIQDEDVLDTWFSSMLWPFSTLGWPNETKDLKYFYPTAVLSTAPEILFFWVARMIMAGLYFIGDIPFSDVYLHSTVRDKQGRKMSKSLGNGIDPLEVIEKHGADALRFTIVSMSPMGLDIKLAFDEKQNDFLVGTRFANKIWNASRYILMNLNDSSIKSPKDLLDHLTFADKWILSNLQNTIEQVLHDINQFRFNDIAKTLYDFIWHDFCDWYIELSKIDLYSESQEKQKRANSILVYVLSESLKLLHPLMPFITEEIWQKLPHEEESIMLSSYPEADRNLIFNKSEKYFKLIQECIYLVRNIRGEMNISPGKKIDCIIITQDKIVTEVFTSYRDYFYFLGKIISLEVSDVYNPNPHYASAVGTGYEIFIPLEGLIDLDIEQARINKDIGKVEKELDKVKNRLSNEKFLEKANKDVIQNEKEKLKNAESNLEKLKKNLKLLS